MARFCPSRAFILDLGGWGFAVPFYFVQDCRWGAKKLLTNFQTYKQVTAKSRSYVRNTAGTCPVRAVIGSSYTFLAESVAEMLLYLGVSKQSIPWSFLSLINNSVCSITNNSIQRIQSAWQSQRDCEDLLTSCESSSQTCPRFWTLHHRVSYGW